MEVKIKTESRKVELGQVRYNSEGLYVLIVNSDVDDCYDAIVLSSGHTVRPFDWNSKNQGSASILYAYPFIAKGVIEITN